MPEVFGSPDQQRMQIVGEQLMRLFSHDTRFASQGRGVQVPDYTDESADLVEALARVIGVTGCEMVPKRFEDTLAQDLERRGLNVYSLMHFIGGESAIDRSIDALKARPLPDDLSVRIIDRDAPAAWLDAFADVAMPHGVLPPIGSVMRGISRPGFAMVAVDENDRPVATAGAVQTRHPDHPDANMVQWGQLATVPDRQGQGIARALGAMAILHAAEHIGARRFRTGINPENAASARLCQSLGVCDSDYVIVVAIDPEVYGDGRLTK